MVVAATRRLVGLCAGAPGSDDRRSSRLHDFEATQPRRRQALSHRVSRARRAGALSGFGEGSPRPRTSESRSNQPRAPRTTPRTDVLRVSPAPHAATRCLDHDLGGGAPDTWITASRSIPLLTRASTRAAHWPVHNCTSLPLSSLQARSQPASSAPVDLARPRPQLPQHVPRLARAHVRVLLASQPPPRLATSSRRDS